MTAFTAYDPAGVIEADGAFDGVPMDAYHGRPDLCAGPSISSSGLRTISDPEKGPAHYWASSPHNPNRVPEEDAQHFRIGRAAHTLILGEEGFREQYVIRPAKWDSWRTNAAKEWRDEHVEAGFTVLEPKDLELIKGMAGLQPWQRDMPDEGLMQSPLVAQGLLQGHIEKSLIWKDAETGIWLRARPDCISESSPGLIVDLKTTKGRPSKAVWDHGYHMQGALAAEGMEKVLGWAFTSFVLVFVDVAPPHPVRIFELDPYQDGAGQMVDPIGIGREQNHRALRKFSECLETGRWPAGPSDSIPLRMPPWYQHVVIEGAKDDAVKVAS